MKSINPIQVGLLMTICIALASCVEKPFQPPPPTFKQFEKMNFSNEDVKREMASCGYMNVYTGRNEGDTISMQITRQNCMFKKGFSYSDGWKGFCFERAFRDLFACQDWPFRNVK